MFDAMLAIILALPILLSISFAVEVGSGLRPLKSKSVLEGGQSPQAVIIIPAHDEESSIAATLEAIGHEAIGIAELLIVADNCTDRTADICSAAGVRCVVRNDPTQRGKGHALAFARDTLATLPPAVVVVIDADCRIDRSSLSALIEAAGARLQPVQAVYLLYPDLAAAPFVQVSNFAFMLRNLIRQRGLARLANRVHLTGTGMAFPWTLFVDADLGGSSIVEDLELGLALAARGFAPSLVEQATVWSPAASATGTLQQRERWEGGFMKHGLPAGLRGIVKSIAKFDGRGLLGAIDLCIPPLVLLGLVDGCAILLTGLAAWWGVAVYPLVAITAATVLAALAVAVAWFREGRPYASFGALAGLPFYLLRKLPMYGRILTRGAPRDWVRTDRVE